MLECRQLSFSYTKDVLLKDVSFALKPGSVTALLSPNAGGKSTLLRLCAGLLRPQHGEVFCQGKNIHQCKPKERAQKIAFLAQESTLPDITVYDLAAHGCYPHLSRRNVLGAEDKRILEQALHQAGAWELRGKRLSRLSGGQRQKARLAMVLAQNTPLLLLDEPTAFLDIRVQLELMQLLGALARQGKTVLLAIHDLPLALAHCKEILVLHEGQICGRDRLEAAFQIQIDERGNALCLGNSTCPRG